MALNDRPKMQYGITLANDYEEVYTEYRTVVILGGD